ncbi:DNA cytosine methyltransferase [Leucobacter chromiiresistens]
MSIQFLDFFAGFGGASSGLVEAGFELVSAYNHWDTAIAVHSANHRDADHVQGDLSGYDMRRLPSAPMLWASPECTWHSPAGGRKRVRAASPTLFGDDPLPADAGVRSRATMYDPIRAAEARGFDIIVIENVVEVASWPLFEPWLKMWEALGYRWKIVNVNAAHVYSATNPAAGQWRDRIYIAFVRDGVPMPRLEPAPPAFCSQCDRVVSTRQHWKKPAPDGAPRVGKYGTQYVYVCDAGVHALQVVEPFVLPAAAVIDWSDLGVRIGDREALGMRKLAAATMRRIEVGLRMFARPAVVAGAGQTWDAANARHPRAGEHDAYYRAWDVLAPLNARQAGGSGDGVAVPPFLVDKYDYTGGDNRRIRGLDNALGTVTTSPHGMLAVPPIVTHHYGDTGGRSGERRVSSIDNALGSMTTTMSQGIAVPPFLAEFYGTGTAAPLGAPVGAMSTAPHHGLAVPPGAFISKHHGGIDYARIEHMNKSTSEPLPAMVTSPNISLVVPERKRPATRFEGELPFELDDVRFRMLGPTEHLRAQRFADGYDTSAANKSETTKGAGNAVAVNVAHWIGDEIKAVLA